MIPVSPRRMAPLTSENGLGDIDGSSACSLDRPEVTAIPTWCRTPWPDNAEFTGGRTSKSSSAAAAVPSPLVTSTRVMGSPGPQPRSNTAPPARTVVAHSPTVRTPTAERVPRAGMNSAAIASYPFEGSLMRGGWRDMEALGVQSTARIQPGTHTCRAVDAEEHRAASSPPTTRFAAVRRSIRLAACLTTLAAATRTALRASCARRHARSATGR